MWFVDCFALIDLILTFFENLNLFIGFFYLTNFFVWLNVFSTLYLSTNIIWILTLHLIFSFLFLSEI